jgi:hypothetical protein
MKLMPKQTEQLMELTVVTSVKVMTIDQFIDLVVPREFETKKNRQTKPKTTYLSISIEHNGINSSRDKWD